MMTGSPGWVWGRLVRRWRSDLRNCLVMRLVAGEADKKTVVVVMMLSILRELVVS